MYGLVDATKRVRTTSVKGSTSFGDFVAKMLKLVPVIQVSLRVSVLTSGSSPSYLDIGGGEDAAVLLPILDITKDVGDDVGGGLDDMAEDEER